MTFRVLVSGSRDWQDKGTIMDAFFFYVAEHNSKGVVLVHGACPTGADAMAEEIATTLGYEIERHPADWETHGKRAGFLRNKEMVDSGIDLALIFIRDNSKGATMTQKLAREAGINTHTYRESDLTHPVPRPTEYKGL